MKNVCKKNYVVCCDDGSWIISHQFFATLEQARNEFEFLKEKHKDNKCLLLALNTIEGENIDGVIRCK